MFGDGLSADLVLVEVAVVVVVALVVVDPFFLTAMASLYAVDWFK